MNYENSKTTEPYRLLINLSDKINLKRSDKYVALSYQIKRSCKSNKFQISEPTWSQNFELPERPYSVSDIQGYFEYITKQHDTLTDNLSIRIHIIKTKNRITLGITKGCHLKLLSPKTRKLLENTISKMTKVENGENVRHLEITEVVLVYCVLFSNDY